MFLTVLGILVLLAALHALYMANEYDIASERRLMRRWWKIAVGAGVLGAAAIVAGCHGGLQ